MTALGIDMSDKEPTIGWDAITPSRKPMPRLVAEAWQKWHEIAADVDRLSNEEFLLPELSAAMKQEHEAQEKYSRIYNFWQEHYWDDILPEELTATVNDNEAAPIFSWLAGDQA